MLQLPFKVMLCLLGVLSGFLLIPQINTHSILVKSFIASILICTVWLLILFRTVRKNNRTLVLNYLPKGNHWIQVIVQAIIIIAICLHWSTFIHQLPLIFAQIIFAYIVEFLAQYSIKDKVQLGFGPLPIVISINLFIWFKDEYFYLQFIMVALGILVKYLFTWHRWGRKRHIFNPSAVSLCAFSLILLFTGTTESLTHASDVSQKLYSDNAYLLLFLTGLVVQYFFSITLMTLFSGGVIFLLGFLYFKATGIYWFIDTNIPPAVFLGIHLLITDPKTSPKTRLGQSIFGALYGTSVFLFYGLLDNYGAPTFYDKILFVPILNLLAPAIDDLSTWVHLKIEPLIKPNEITKLFSKNLFHMASWGLLFGALLFSGYFSPHHPGRKLDLWTSACREHNQKACEVSIRLQIRECEKGRGEICNLLATKLLSNTFSNILTMGLHEPEFYFHKSCSLGNDLGCLNLLNHYVFVRQLPQIKNLLGPALKSVTTNCKKGNANSCYVAGFAFYSGAGTDALRQKALPLFEEGCVQGQFKACGQAGQMYIQGDGVEVNIAKAGFYFEKACIGGESAGCKILKEMKQSPAR